jgi:hypothetical protein
MCRSIKVLRRESTPPTGEEIAAASLQFVRKVSGYRKPSKANQEAFDAAVREIAATTDRLLQVVAETYPQASEARRSSLKSSARRRAIARPDELVEARPPDPSG